MAQREVDMPKSITILLGALAVLAATIHDVFVGRSRG
jgi:hypothetical protein